jgi:predicted MFS family arabinose efflux permease
MIGVAIAGFLGVRAVFGAVALLYCIAAILAVWGLPKGREKGRSELIKGQRAVGG